MHRTEWNGDKNVNLRDLRALSGIYGRLCGLLKVYMLLMQGIHSGVGD